MDKLELDGRVARLERRVGWLSTAILGTLTLIGVEDLVVIDTQDALLITRPDRAQDVKRVVETLTAQGRTELT